MMFCLRIVTVVGAAHGLSITECLWLGPGTIWQQGPTSRAAQPGNDFSCCVFLAHVSQLLDEILSHSSWLPAPGKRPSTNLC